MKKDVIAGTQRRMETMKSLQGLFPKASKSFLAVNPLPQPSQIAPTRSKVKGGGRKGHPIGFMNRTETEFAQILEAMKLKGEILRYEFEGITLRFAGVKYTPDLVVFIHRTEHSRTVGEQDVTSLASIKLIEVKGAFIGGKFERAIERFRHARTYWPEFSFELHQKTKNGWKQLL